MKSSDSGGAMVQDLGLGYLLARLGSQAHGVWSKMLEGHDMVPSQFIMLNIIAGLGSAHQQQISDAMGIDARNAGGIVDKLVARNLIDRARDKQDRRKQILCVTSKGKALINKIKTIESKLESKFAVGLAEEQRQQLQALLHKLYVARGGG